MSVLHCTPGNEHALMTAFRVFLDTCKTSFPTGLQWSFPTGGVVIEEETGDVVSSWSDGTPVAALAAAGASTWANGVGVRVKWRTNFTFQGRKVVGSTFLVPLVVGVYEGAGNITDATISFFNVAIATFVATDTLRVYARPRPIAGGTIADGVSFPVFSGECPDRVSWLRGRRT